MVIVPAAAAAYAAAIRSPTDPQTKLGLIAEMSETRSCLRMEPERKLALASHLAVWMIPIVVLAVNAFWWLPGIWLASTKGASDFAFAHPEGVTRTALADHRNREPPIESCCWRRACRDWS